MQRGTNDGGGECVRGAARLGPAPHAAGVRPAHRHLHRVRHRAQRAERREEGVCEQHYSVEAELHYSVAFLQHITEPVSLGPHEQFNTEGQAVWVSGL